MSQQKPDPERIDIRVRRKKADDPIAWQVRLNRSFLEGEADSLCEANDKVKAAVELMGWQIDLPLPDGADADAE